MKKTNIQKIQEGLADLADKCEKDHEVQMARSELYKLSKYSIKLHDLLKSISEKEGLQAWQQSYITKAADYIDAVYQDLQYEQEIGREIDTDIDKAEAEPMTTESRKYFATLHQNLAEKIKHNMEPAGIGHFKIVKKPTGFRIIVGLSAEGLTSKNAEHLSGDLKPNQIKREIDSVKRQLNLKDMKPYDENTQKILNKL